MRRRDSDKLPFRAVYLGLRGEFRVRQTLRSLTQTSGWTIAGVVWLVLGLAFRSWILFAAFGALLLLTVAGWAADRYYLSRARLEDLDEMTGWEFERWLEQFFKRVAFDVKRTPYRGDFGADFVLTWNGVRIAVQAKRSRRQVGVSAVQEVVAAKAYYGCEQAMVVTNGYFSEQAIILARANGVRMRFRDDLARELAALDEDNFGLQAATRRPAEFVVS
jgi:restriction system protein